MISRTSRMRRGSKRRRCCDEWQALHSVYLRDPHLRDKKEDGRAQGGMDVQQGPNSTGQDNILEGEG